ncbi:hypothetical protein MLD38_029097 [Melastoma candidum]|uniref:Uncharacterized protein n=1 Tax=Melastoma candidum TaxID=119954 RepID=A0ACB9N2P8_9MYRT|nr:hypothetical protein MLD38_029097 [Melastoma candidum]
MRGLQPEPFFGKQEEEDVAFVKRLPEQCDQIDDWVTQRLVRRDFSSLGILVHEQLRWHRMIAPLMGYQQCPDLFFLEVVQGAIRRYAQELSRLVFLALLHFS